MRAFAAFVVRLMQNRMYFYGYLLALGWLCLSLFFQPTVFFYGNGELIACAPAGIGRQGQQFSLRFIHSVQKTPVREDLVVEPDGFRLLRTEYQSFGVGLPFLETEGDFRQEGNVYVMDHMDRRFPELSLRTGVGTQLTLYLNGKEYKLYAMFPPGTRIDVRVEPVYRKWI